MAKTTVEILGGQLDGTILNNMASEATMRELLAAVKANSSGAGGGRGSSNPRNNTTSKLSKSSGLMSKLADTLGNQLGNTIGAVGSMGAMLGLGNTKMSAYTRVLNDQVISKLPLVGGLLGGLGGIVTDSIEVFEDWNDSLKTGTQNGATFGNSILRASKAATSAAMDLDSYMRMVNENSSTMLNLGKTVTEGSERFSRVSRLLNRDGGLATQTLRQMGMNAKDVNQALLNYVDIMGGGMFTSKKSDLLVAHSFEQFQLNLMRLTSLTGKSVSKLQEEMAVASKDVVFKMALNKIENTAVRTKIIDSLSNFTAMYGEAGAELFKSLFLGMPPGNEDARNLMVLMPDLVRSMRSSIATARDTNISVDQFNERIESDIIKAMLTSARTANGLDQLLAAAGAGYGDVKSFTKSITPILDQLNKYGDISKLTEKDLRLMFKKARDEQKARDELTKFLNDFEMAMQDLKFELMEFLFPLLEKLGNYLEKQDLPGKVRQFGEFLKDSVEKYLPDVITFFKYLGDDNGRQFIWNEVTYFFKRMGIEFVYHVKSMFNKDNIRQYETDRNDALEEAFKDYSAKQGLLEPKLPSRYTAQDRVEGPHQTGKPGVTETGTKDTKMTSASDKIVAELKTKNLALTNPLGQGSAFKLNSGFAGIRQYRDEHGRLIKEAPHAGLDVGANLQKLYAAMDGTISYSHGGGYGYHAIITNEKTGVKLIYGHMHQELSRALATQITGSKIKAGQEIGVSGGGAGDPGAGTSTGRHLHFEARDASDTVFDPSSFIKYNSGTLGVHGKLFKDFGAGTNVMLEDNKAVMTPEQMNSVMAGASGVATTEMLESLDRNFTTLVTLMQERNELSGQQLSHIEQNQVNIA